MGKPTYNVCIAKRLPLDKTHPNTKRAFTTVGVAWDNESGNGLRLVFDITVILTPEDEVFVMKRREFSQQ